MTDIVDGNLISTKYNNKLHKNIISKSVQEEQRRQDLGVEPYHAMSNSVSKRKVTKINEDEGV